MLDEVNKEIDKKIRIKLCANEDKYKGYFKFFVNTINNVAKITNDEIIEIDKNIKKFSRPKYNISMEYYNQICTLLFERQLEYLSMSRKDKYKIL